MTSDLIDFASFALAGTTAAGLLQCLGGWAALARFRTQRSAEPAVLPGVTILKPLHGDEPLLEEALASCLRAGLSGFPDRVRAAGPQ